jgi:hypothetical protein
LSHEQDPTCRCSNLELYYFRVTLTTRRNVEPRFLRIVGAPFSVVTFLDVTIPVLAPVARRGFCLTLTDDSAGIVLARGSAIPRVGNLAPARKRKLAGAFHCGGQRAPAALALRCITCDRNECCWIAESKNLETRTRPNQVGFDLIAVGDVHMMTQVIELNLSAYAGTANTNITPPSRSFFMGLQM